MSRCGRGVWLVAAVCLLGGAARAEPGFRPASGDTLGRRALRWTILPIVFTTPDTEWAVGVLPQALFYVSPEAGRPSSVRLDAYYTMRGQLHAQVVPRLWLRDDALLMAGSFSFKDWPNRFYGLGGRVGDDDPEGYTERRFDVELEVQQRVGPGLYVGGRYEVRSYTLRDLDPGGLLEGSGLAGAGGGRSSGVGGVVIRDTRDRVTYPTAGAWVQLSATGYARAWGSDFRFAVAELDARRYAEVRPGQVFALQGYVRLTFGEPPFRDLAGLGSVLRGYGSTRIVDRTVAAGQLEYRLHPVWWRLGVVLFAGAGVTDEAPSGLPGAKAYSSVGIGLRYCLLSGEMINVRWDYGFGRGASGDYLDLGEAF